MFVGLTDQDSQVLLMRRACGMVFLTFAFLPSGRPSISSPNWEAWAAEEEKKGGGERMEEEVFREVLKQATLTEKSQLHW